MSTRRPGTRFSEGVPTNSRRSLGIRGEETPTPAEPNGSAAPGNTDGNQRSSVVLGPNDRLVGQLYIEGDVRVSGNVEGALEATGDIEIAGAGKVSGTVTAYNRLVVGGGASLVGGEVRVARLTVEDGATFSGHVTMGSVDKAAPAQAPRAEAQPEPQVEEAPAVEAAAPAVVESEPVRQQKGRRR